MNSQELEQSLRSEIESYLKELLSELQQEISQIREQFNSDVEKHKTEMNSVLQNALAKVENRHELTPSLRDSLVEHLRLSKDEGARITAIALDEAEKLNLNEPPPLSSAPPPATPEPSADLSQISAAVSDIGGKQSQAEVLSALLSHAENFAPRGVFFILKNERLGAWRAFGADELSDEKLQDISVAVESQSILSEAVSSLQAVNSEAGKFADDTDLMSRLEFGNAAQMTAVPLVARGRGVAVLYADEKGTGSGLNSSALEILMRVAGLTVERLAAAKEAAAAAESRPEPVEETAAEPQAVEAEPSSVEAESPVVEAEPQIVAEPEITPEPEMVEVEPEIAPEPEVMAEPEVMPEIERNEMTAEPEADYNKTVQMSREELMKEVTPDPAKTTTLTEPVAELSTKPAASQPTGKVKLSWRERNSQLPIEVDEAEKPDHIEAQRFARLLVSEIKLYNEQRVKEGRKMGDIYDRLREAVDRSREAYDGRVKPEVASKFDYLHNEMLKTLAEGDEKKFGVGYPGQILK